MPIIPYNQENLQKCRCGTCPVHNASACVAQRQQAMQPAMAGPSMGSGMAGEPMPSMGGGTMARPSAEAQSVMLPDPNMIEGIYCSQAVGKSECADLNGRLACVCPTCAVWQGYNLLTNYFCIHGSAS